MSKFQKIYEEFQQTLNENQVSVKEIEKEFGRDFEGDEAKEIQKLMKYPGSDKKAEENLEKIDKLIDGHGVEVINGEKNTPGGFWQNAVAAYVNIGDTYNATVLYDVNEKEFLLTTWGDWAEKNQEKYDIQ